MDIQRLRLLNGNMGGLRLPEGNVEVIGELAVEDRMLVGKSSSGDVFVLPRRPLFVYEFTQHTFTTAELTGPYGPTYEQLMDWYFQTGWIEDREFYNVQDGMQIWTVPRDGLYRIEAAGARGGWSQGHGAIVAGTFDLRMGTKLRIIAGQRPNGGRAGGGGSFVFKNGGDSLDDLLIAAGGGGGDSGGSSAVGIGLHTENGAGGGGNRNGAGGIAGQGGNATAYSSSIHGGGGAGFLSDGGTALEYALFALRPFSGATGGIGNQSGGFGGGGYAIGTSRNYAGGGGGFSGGGGSVSTGATNQRARGGGGGSYNAGEDQTGQSGANTSDGYVTITKL